MELSELRRGWQQPAPPGEAGALDAAALTRLLAQTSRSPIAKMRRNVWLEIGVVVVCLAGCVGAALLTQDGYYLLMTAWLGLICLLSGFYFWRKLAVLRSLGDAGGGAVREHMAQQLSSLRRLVQLYYQGTMLSVPISFTVGIIFLSGRLVQKLDGHQLLVSLGILGAFYCLGGGLTYFMMRGFTRWYLQRLYGQHLDRLETNLRELEEPAV